MQGRESDTGVRNYIQIDFLAYHRPEVIPDTVIKFHLYVVIITGDTPVIECPLVQSMKSVSYTHLDVYKRQLLHPRAVERA